MLVLRAVSLCLHLCAWSFCVVTAVLTCSEQDTMSAASDPALRHPQESTGVPGAIHVSEETWGALGGDGQLAEDERWQARGVEAKGKGRLNTYLWQEML